jgi:hypothetical protein
MSTTTKSALLEQLTATDKRTEKINLDTILTKGLQTREGTNPDTVAAYAEIYRAGGSMPPIVVFSDGGDAFYLADGHHRVAGARKAKLEEIEGLIKKGDRRDALWYATAANAQHGLPRTNEDKRRAVTLILADEEWRTYSDAQIAEHAKVSDRLVAKVRKEVGAESATRKGKDGKTRVKPTPPTQIDPAATIDKLVKRVSAIVEAQPVATWNEYGACTNAKSLTICKRERCLLAISIAYDGPECIWRTAYIYQTKTQGGGGPPIRGDGQAHTDPCMAVGLALSHAATHVRDWPKDVDAFLTASVEAFPIPKRQEQSAASDPPSTPPIVSDSPAPDVPPGPEEISPADIAPEGQAIADAAVPPQQPAGSEDLFAGQESERTADPHRNNLRALGLRRVDKQREILQHKMLHNKTTWTGTDQELLTLAMLAGIPSRPVAWIDAVKAQARDMFITVVRAEVADRIRTGEAVNARKWPQLAEICRLFDLDHQAIEIEAERAVPE